MSNVPASPPAPPVPLKEKVILGEIAAKNSAIRGYNTTLWKIRSGYLTLLFGAWAAMLALVKKDGVELDELRPFIRALVFVSIGLFMGGIFADTTYLRRKFRLFKSLDRLMRCAANLDKMSEARQNRELKAVLKVAGGTGDKTYKGKGYCEALVCDIAIFLLPLVFTLIGAEWLAKFLP